MKCQLSGFIPVPVGSSSIWRLNLMVSFAVERPVPDIKDPASKLLSPKKHCLYVKPKEWRWLSLHRHLLQEKRLIGGGMCVEARKGALKIPRIKQVNHQE